MRKMTRRAFGVAGVAVAMAAATAGLAQQPQATRIRAMIENVDGNVLMVKARNGDQLKVMMADNARYAAMIKATLDDLKPDTYIGVTSMPQPDGTLKAVAIHIFQSNQRGTGESHRPWDLTPGSMMTNAAIETTVASSDGQSITVK